MDDEQVWLGVYRTVLGAMLPSVPWRPNGVSNADAVNQALFQAMRAIARDAAEQGLADYRARWAGECTCRAGTGVHAVGCALEGNRS